MAAKINLSRATQFLLSAVVHAQHACKRTREMVVRAMARLQMLLAIAVAAS